MCGTRAPPPTRKKPKTQIDTQMSKAFDLRAAFSSSNYHVRYRLDLLRGLKTHPSVFFVDWYDGLNHDVFMFDNDYPRFIRRVDSDERCDLSAYECGDILIDPYSKFMFLAPFYAKPSLATALGNPPSLVLLNQSPVEMHFDNVCERNEFAPLNLTTLATVMHALECALGKRRRIEILMTTWLAPDETFLGFVPRKTLRRNRSGWIVNLQVAGYTQTVDLNSHGISIELRLHNEVLAVGDIGPAYLDYDSRRFHDTVLEEFSFRSSLRQEALVVSGSTFDVRAFETSHTLRVRVGATRLHLHRVRFNPADVSPETKAAFVLLAPIGTQIPHLENDVDIDTVHPITDLRGAEFWAWPHYFLTEVASVLLDLHLPVYCVLWILDYLPNMAGWPALAKVQTLEALVESRRRVWANRTLPESSSFIQASQPPAVVEQTTMAQSSTQSSSTPTPTLDQVAEQVKR